MTRYCLSALAEVDGALRRAKRVLIASDLDGTLCQIAPSPGEARLLPATAEILRRMRGRQDITLAILSGRSLKELILHTPEGNVYSGNHGLEINGHGLRFEHNDAIALRPDLEAVCEALSHTVQAWSGAWVEDKRLTATLHYRDVDPRQHNRLRFAVRRSIAGFGRKFRLRAGKKALEICPRIDWDKGSALNYIRQKLGPFDACICIGDDRTDEAMFRRNGGQLNIRVGCNGPTHAGFFLSDATETPVFLEHLLHVIGNEAAQPARVAASGLTEAPNVPYANP